MIFLIFSINSISSQLYWNNAPLVGYFEDGGIKANKTQRQAIEFMENLLSSASPRSPMKTANSEEEAIYDLTRILGDSAEAHLLRYLQDHSASTHFAYFDGNIFYTPIGYALAQDAPPSIIEALIQRKIQEIKLPLFFNKKDILRAFEADILCAQTLKKQENFDKILINHVVHSSPMVSQILFEFKYDICLCPNDIN